MPLSLGNIGWPGAVIGAGLLGGALTLGSNLYTGRDAFYVNPLGPNPSSPVQKELRPCEIPVPGSGKIPSPYGPCASATPEPQRIVVDGSSRPQPGRVLRPGE
ncbi:MAG TPA: hypothetical protein VD948_11375 [Rhodothermales bacterium]|nr:hypothetical protein [Rhodothermales bacterium]